MARAGIGAAMAPGVATAGAAAMDGMVIIIAADTVAAIWVDTMAVTWAAVTWADTTWADTPVDIPAVIQVATRAVTTTTKSQKRATP